MAKSEHKRIVDLWRGRGERAENVRAGLRCDGQPRKGLKPCGCLYGSCLKCAKTTNKRIIMPALIEKMYADYQSGMSLEAVGRKYPLKHGKKRSHGEIGLLFRRRGLAVRTGTEPKLGFGVRIPEPTEVELAAFIAKAGRIFVPKELRVHWRRWSLQKRGDFIARLRKKLNLPFQRPTLPYSKNVTPFDYGTQAAWDIAAVENHGLPSRNWRVRILPSSWGVIYKGELFFWANDAYMTGCYPREILHHRIWTERHGAVPKQHIVIQKDGNKNNFAPGNLKLMSMADNARRNGIHRRLQADPLNPKLLAIADLRLERIKATRAVTEARKARAKTVALLSTGHNVGGLLATLAKKQ